MPSSWFYYVVSCVLPSCLSMMEIRKENLSNAVLMCSLVDRWLKSFQPDSLSQTIKYCSHFLTLIGFIHNASSMYQFSTHKYTNTWRPMENINICKQTKNVPSLHGLGQNVQQRSYREQSCTSRCSTCAPAAFSTTYNTWGAQHRENWRGFKYLYVLKRPRQIDGSGPWKSQGRNKDLSFPKAVVWSWKGLTLKP